MPFEWIGFLRLAEELAERTEEAALRTAISRAYYAAFCTARQRLKQEGVDFDEDTNVHKSVWETYEKADNGPRYYIGSDGKRLRRTRNRVDYSEEPLAPNDAKKALREAKTILSALDRLA